MTRPTCPITRRALTLAAMLLAIAASNASAQGFINPFVGTTLTNPTGGGGHSNPGLGVAFGTLGKIVGLETEIAYYPDVLDDSANGLAKSKVITFSGNTLIGPTVGPVKVYGAAGIGDLYLNVASASSLFVPSPASISNNYFTVNVGGGVMGFFMPHLGIRGDLRYYRAFGFTVNDVQGAGLALDHFSFWRGGIGLAVKF